MCPKYQQAEAWMRSTPDWNRQNRATKRRDNAFNAALNKQVCADGRCGMPSASLPARLGNARSRFALATRPSLVAGMTFHRPGLDETVLEITEPILITPTGP
jgi:hypothetical protein